MKIARLTCVSFVVGFLTPWSAMADVYVYKNKQGVLIFTNVPTHAGYRRVIKESNSQSSAPASLSNPYEDLIRSAADRHSIDPDLIRAVIKAESGFNSNARSHKGALGLMQLMPETARLHNVTDILNPSDNIDGGIRHLKLLLSRYQGDLELSLAAYNAGIKAVEKYGGIPPFAETREYVRRVLQYYGAYRGTGLQVIQRIQ
jgi:soluble lytic murein transglycosylase